jgi:hypothetical protein
MAYGGAALSDPVRAAGNGLLERMGAKNEYHLFISDIHAPGDGSAYGQALTRTSL